MKNTDNRIQILPGDITHISADAIVNSANSTLLGGGGVDGAIHRAAGPQLLTECRKLGGCRTGQAKITSGYNLPAKYVIHTVGPVWTGGASGESADLENCYINSLSLANQYHLQTVAFPAISTGIYGYPIREATQIALSATRDFLQFSDRPETVIFVCYSAQTLAVYNELIKEYK